MPFSEGRAVRNKSRQDAYAQKETTSAAKEGANLQKEQKISDKVGDWWTTGKLVRALKKAESNYIIQEQKAPDHVWKSPEVQEAVQVGAVKLIETGEYSRAIDYIEKSGQRWEEIRKLPKVHEAGVRFINKSLEDNAKKKEKAPAIDSICTYATKGDLQGRFMAPELRKNVKITLWRLLDPSERRRLSDAKTLVETFGIRPEEFSSPGDQRLAATYLLNSLRGGWSHERSNDLSGIVGFGEEVRTYPSVAQAAIEGLVSEINEDKDCKDLKTIDKGGFLPKDVFSRVEVQAAAQAQIEKHLKGPDYAYFEEGAKNGNRRGIPLKEVVTPAFEEKIRTTVFGWTAKGLFELMEKVNGALGMGPNFYSTEEGYRAVRAGIHVSWKEGRETTPEKLRELFGFSVDSLQSPEDQSVLAQAVAGRLDEAKYRPQIERIVDKSVVPYATEQTKAGLQAVSIKALKVYLAAKKDSEFSGSYYDDKKDTLMTPERANHVSRGLGLTDEVLQESSLRTTAWKALLKSLHQQGRFEQQDASAAAGVREYVTRFKLEEQIKTIKGKEAAKAACIFELRQLNLDRAKEVFEVAELTQEIFSSPEAQQALEKGWKTILVDFRWKTEEVIARIQAIKENYPQFVPQSHHQGIANHLWDRSAEIIRISGSANAVETVLMVIRALGWDTSVIERPEPQAVFKEALLHNLNNPTWLSDDFPKTIELLRMPKEVLQEPQMQAAYHKCRPELEKRNNMQDCILALDRLFTVQSRGAYR